MPSASDQTDTTLKLRSNSKVHVFVGKGWIPEQHWVLLKKRSGEYRMEPFIMNLFFTLDNFSKSSEMQCFPDYETRQSYNWTMRDQRRAGPILYYPVCSHMYY